MLEITVDLEVVDRSGKDCGECCEMPHALEELAIRRRRRPFVNRHVVKPVRIFLALFQRRHLAATSTQRPVRDKRVLRPLASLPGEQRH